MPAISFSVFLPKIVDGTKTQTIRQERKNPIKKGDTLQLYWNQRSSQGFKIGDAVCSKVRSVLIYFNGVRLFDETDSKAIVSETILDRTGLDNFAQQDGFDRWDEMKAFFDRNYTLPFHGVLIEWESLELSEESKPKINETQVSYLDHLEVKDLRQYLGTTEQVQVIPYVS